MKTESFVKWLECEAISFQTGTPLTMSLYKNKITLREAFLEFRDEPLQVIVPITDDIVAACNDKKLWLKFPNLNGISLLLVFTNSGSLEVFANEMSICLSNAPNKPFLKELNISVLNKMSIEESVLRSVLDSSTFQLQDIRTFPGVPYSIVNDHSLKSLWEKSVFIENSGYATTFYGLRVSVITWNVASVKPDPMVLKEITDAFQCGSMPSDLVFIALQEIDMGVVSVVAGNSKVSGKWSKIVNEAVNKSAIPFTIIGQNTLGGVYAALLVRKDVQVPIVLENIKSIRLGAYGMAANKGAVEFFVQIGCTRFIMIGCHLSPHTENWDQRNEQIRFLFEGIKERFDYCLIVGDLNYRTTLTYNETIQYISQDKIQDLLQYDQLRITMKQDDGISRLKEPNITFPPTYKFDKDSSVYDTSPKKRVPSWTDRVLVTRGPKRLSVGQLSEPVFEFKSKQTKNFPKMPQCVSFRSGNCQFSDHRSVTACYVFSIPVISQEKANILKSSIQQYHNNLEEVIKPRLTTDKTTLDFPRETKITLSNKSKGWSYWTVEAYKGIRVSPRQGLLLPGQIENLSLIATNDKFEDGILLINVENGLPTCVEIRKSVKESDLIQFD